LVLIGSLLEPSSEETIADDGGEVVRDVIVQDDVNHLVIGRPDYRRISLDVSNRGRRVIRQISNHKWTERKHLGTDRFRSKVWCVWTGKNSHRTELPVQ
jgi:hypothetical protein